MEGHRHDGENMCRVRQVRRYVDRPTTKERPRTDHHRGRTAPQAHLRGQLASDARPHDQMHFVIHAHGFTHAFQSANIRVEDFLDRDRYIDELLGSLYEDW